MLDLINLESQLLSILFKMKNIGTPILTDKLSSIIKNEESALEEASTLLTKSTGIEVWKQVSLKKYCEDNNIAYPKTQAGNPSFVAIWLENHVDENLNKCAEIRKKFKLVDTFLKKQIQENIIDGRIYPSFHSFRGGGGGTTTGRFSSSNPNLQQIPKTETINIRSIFGEKNKLWFSIDYSQIELRLFAHYSKSKMLLDAYYNGDDVHQKMADMLGVERRIAKNITFGIIYGMGNGLLGKVMNISSDQAKHFRDEYYKAFPEIKTLTNQASHVANERGFVRTIMGRKRHFDQWQCVDGSCFSTQEEAQNRAREKFNKGEIFSAKVQRADSYKALNAIIQGSSADLFKKALVDLKKEGIFDSVIGYPTNLVHDEVNFCFSEHKLMKENVTKIKYILENAIKLRIPVEVDVEFGPSWGELENYAF